MYRNRALGRLLPPVHDHPTSSEGPAKSIQVNALVLETNKKARTNKLRRWPSYSLHLRRLTVKTMLATAFTPRGKGTASSAFGQTERLWLAGFCSTSPERRPNWCAIR